MGSKESNLYSKNLWSFGLPPPPPPPPPPPAGIPHYLAFPHPTKQSLSEVCHKCRSFTKKIVNKCRRRTRHGFLQPIMGCCSWIFMSVNLARPHKSCMFRILSFMRVIESVREGYSFFSSGTKVYNRKKGGC